MIGGFFHRKTIYTVATKGELVLKLSQTKVKQVCQAFDLIIINIMTI